MGKLSHILREKTFRSFTQEMINFCWDVICIGFHRKLVEVQVGILTVF